MDVIGKVYVDLIVTGNELPRLVNLVHPQPAGWEVIMKGIQSVQERDLPSISLERWVKELEGISAGVSSQDIVRVVSPLYRLPPTVY